MSATAVMSAARAHLFDMGLIVPSTGVAAHVRDLRLAAGWSQAELAAMLHVSRQTVISIENGRYLPSLPLAFRIARLFSRPLEAIFKSEEG